MTSSAVAFDAVLAGAGATLPARDAADSRIMGEVASASGGCVDHPASVGGWPSLASGTPPSLGPGRRPPGRRRGWYTNLKEYLNDTDPLSSSH